ncbi:MAG: DUF373 family protein [Thermoplasmatota archaeon]
MAKTLVLCVDRDNDFGTKAGVSSPLIGRRQNMHAAIRLALADPEDSDSNSLFAAIKLYDELRGRGQQVEIATVCGDPDVGRKSDHLVALQLGEVISRLQPDRAIVVSDGPEDEWVLPMLRARLKVQEVRRVVVKQSERIESTLYIIRKGMTKENIQMKVILPVSLLLMVWGAFAITGIYTPQNLALGSIAFFVGTFFLLQTLHLRDRVEESIKELRAGMLSAKLSIFTSLISFMLIFIGAAYTYQTTASLGIPTVEEAFLFFVSGFLWWIVPAIIVREGGSFADEYLRLGRRRWANAYMTLSGVAMVFLLSAALTLVRFFLGHLHGRTADQILQEVLIYIAVTIMIAVFGAVHYRLAHEKRPGEAGVRGDTE